MPYEGSERNGNEVKLRIKLDFIWDFAKLEALKKNVSLSEYVERLIIEEYNSKGGQNV